MIQQKYGVEFIRIQFSEAIIEFCKNPLLNVDHLKKVDCIRTLLFNDLVSAVSLSRSDIESIWSSPVIYLAEY